MNLSAAALITAVGLGACAMAVLVVTDLFDLRERKWLEKAPLAFLGAAMLAWAVSFASMVPSLFK